MASDAPVAPDAVIEIQPAAMASKVYRGASKIATSVPAR
jgi:hypothetical protein